MMKRIPKFFKDYKYQVKYIWQIIAEALVLPERSPKEIARMEAEGAAQWEALGVEFEEF